jgi:hypothetical protein
MIYDDKEFLMNIDHAFIDEQLRVEMDLQNAIALHLKPSEVLTITPVSPSCTFPALLGSNDVRSPLNLNAAK